jgi:hypothetical protein
MAGELVPDFLVDLLSQGNWIGIPGEVRERRIKKRCLVPYMSSVLRNKDVYPGSRILDPTFHPGSGVNKILDPDPHQRI